MCVYVTGGRLSLGRGDRRNYLNETSSGHRRTIEDEEIFGGLLRGRYPVPWVYSVKWFKNLCLSLGSDVTH